MSCPAIDTAAALAAELNDPARGWSLAFTAQRLYLPSYSREDLQAPRVAVVPPVRTGNVVTRGNSTFRYGLVVDVQQLVDATDVEAVDALVELVDGELTAFFADLHRLATLQAWKIVEVALVDEAVYSLDRLQQDGIFEAALVVTVQGFIGGS